MSDKNHKKHLVELTNAVVGYLNVFDRTMKRPESRERGEQLAELANLLEMANDSAMHFGLGLSFNQIKKKKVK